MGCRPNIPEHMPKAFQDLMVECWDTDPEKRPPFEEVLKRLQVSVSCLPCLLLKGTVAATGSSHVKHDAGREFPLTECYLA